MARRYLSPLYSFRINSTGTWIAPIQQMPQAKYKPFNYVRVENKDSADVELVINGSLRKRIPAGTIMEFEPPVIPNIYELRIEGVATAGAVEVSIQKKPSLEQLLYKVVGWLR